jgi:uncharacterized protein YycO
MKNKGTIMKKIITLLAALVFTSSVLAEETKAYTQFDTFRFTVNNKDAKKLTSNMRSHIKNTMSQVRLKAKFITLPMVPILMN